MALPDPAYVLLPVTLGLMFWYLRNDKADYETFKQLNDTCDRQRVFRGWVIKSFLVFGLTSLVGLWLLGQVSSLWTMPAVFENVLPDLESIEWESGGFIGGMISTIKYMAIPAFLFGGLANALFTVIANRNRQADAAPADGPRAIGDIESLMPRNSREKFWAALISINAGFSEELFFRLFLPLMFWLVTGNVIVALVVSSILFGLAHYYQGIVGVFATTFFGVAMLMIYLVTHSIWLVVILHVVNDLNALITVPWIVRRFGQPVESPPAV